MSAFQSSGYGPVNPSSQPSQRRGDVHLAPLDHSIDPAASTLQALQAGNLRTPALGQASAVIDVCSWLEVVSTWQREERQSTEEVYNPFRFPGFGRPKVETVTTVCLNPSPILSALCSQPDQFIRSIKDLREVLLWIRGIPDLLAFAAPTETPTTGHSKIGMSLSATDGRLQNLEKSIQVLQESELTEGDKRHVVQLRLAHGVLVRAHRLLRTVNKQREAKQHGGDMLAGERSSADRSKIDRARARINFVVDAILRQKSLAEKSLAS